MLVGGCDARARRSRLNAHVNGWWFRYFYIADARELFRSPAGAVALSFPVVVVVVVSVVEFFFPVAAGGV